MKRRNAAINAVQSLYDENVELKQKLSALHSNFVGVEGEDKTPNMNRFATMCFERGRDAIIKLVDNRFDKDIKKNKDESYETYDEWIHRTISGYSNPFDNYDTRFLLVEFSMKELLVELEPWLRGKYRTLLQNQRLNDIKKD